MEYISDLTTTTKSTALNCTFPESDTPFYPVYCYQNSECVGSKIGCTTQLLISILPILNCIPLGYLIWKEIAIQSQIKWGKPTKFIALSCTFGIQICFFGHYFFTSKSATSYFIILENALQDFAFLTFCYLFCKDSS